MGKHMEQIALFVLKNSAVLEDDQNLGQSDGGDVQFSHEDSVSSAYSAFKTGIPIHPVASTHDHGRINRPLFVPSDNGSIDLSLSGSEDPLKTDALNDNGRIASDYYNLGQPFPRWTKLMGGFVSPRAIRTKGYDFDIINPYEIIIKTHLSEFQIEELVNLTKEIRRDTRVTSLNGWGNDEPLLDDLEDTDEWAWKSNIATELQRTDISVRAARAKGFEASVEGNLVVVKPPPNLDQYNELLELSKEIRGADTDGARSSLPSIPSTKHTYYSDDPEYELALPPSTGGRPDQNVEAFSGPRPDVRPRSEEVGLLILTSKTRTNC